MNNAQKKQPTSPHIAQLYSFFIAASVGTNCYNFKLCNWVCACVCSTYTVCFVTFWSQKRGAKRELFLRDVPINCWKNLFLLSGGHVLFTAWCESHLKSVTILNLVCILSAKQIENGFFLRKMGKKTITMPRTDRNVHASGCLSCCQEYKKCKDKKF